MLTRRAFVGSSTAALALSTTAPRRYRYAVCNETFDGQTFRESCRLAKKTGYEGMEISPGTLAANPASLSVEQRRVIRVQMADSGLRFAGLHSLVSAPTGLHLTTPDNALRTKSWEFFRKLIDLSADLGPHGVMVLGSGKQRAAVDGSTVADARARLQDGLASLALHAGNRGVLLLLEPLSPQFTNVVNTLAEAAALVEEIGSPSVESMFDTHNTVAETEAHDTLLRRYASHIRHVHLNELNGRHPGTGNYNFGLVLNTLREIGYNGWVSLEVFQFKPTGEAIAQETMDVLKRLERAQEERR